MPAAAGPVEVGFIDASLDLRGEALDWRFVDIDGDGRRELCLAVRTEEGQRELRLHRAAADRVEPEPYATIHMLEDVLAYGFADLRAEPGLELLLLTRTGAFSYSPTRTGYRGNARRLLTADLIYDVPDPHGLPYWSYVLPGPGGDRVIVPVRGGMELWGPPDADSPGGDQGDYRRLTQLAGGERGFVEPDDFSRRARRRSERSQRGLNPRVDIETDFGPFFEGSLPTGGPQPSDSLVSVGRSIAAPALIDVDRDGRLDLVRWEWPRLSVHLATERGFSPSPTASRSCPSTSAGRASSSRCGCATSTATATRTSWRSSPATRTGSRTSRSPCWPW